MKKLSRFSQATTWPIRMGDCQIVTEKDGCSYVEVMPPHAPGGRGPKKHSRKAALLAFWKRGIIA